MDETFVRYMQRRLGRVLDQLAALRRENELLRAENRRLRSRLARLDEDVKSRVA